MKKEVRQLNKLASLIGKWAKIEEDDYFEDEGIKIDFAEDILCSIGNGPFVPYSDVKRGFEETEDAEFEIIEQKKLDDKQY